MKGQRVTAGDATPYSPHTRARIGKDMELPSLPVTFRVVQTHSEHGAS